LLAIAQDRECDEMAQVLVQIAGRQFPIMAGLARLLNEVVVRARLGSI
jgi:hypothetical protein